MSDYKGGAVLSFLHRAILFLVRKKGKTVILFLIIFIISTFILSSFSLLYATKDVAKNMRTAIGASFHIYSLEGLQFDDNMDRTKQTYISQNAIHEIMKDKEIKYYNARNSGYAKSKEISFIPGRNHAEENSMGQVSANNYSALNSLFQDGTLEILEGRHIIPGDENVLLISKQLADFNHLSVGDVIPLSPAELSKKDNALVDSMKDTQTIIDAKIIGIYQIISSQADEAYQPTAGLRANLLFSDHLLLDNLGLEKMGEYSGGVSFFIQDPIYLNTVIQEVKQMDTIDWDKFFIRKDDWNFEKISSGLKTIQNLTTTLLICVCAVSIGALLLILAMRIRYRIHEAGILLSVGIQKREIMGQFIVEALILTAVAFILSYFMSGFVSVIIEGRLLENMQIRTIDEQALKTGLDRITQKEILLKTPFYVTLAIYCCQLLVIILSVCISSWRIIKLKPKDILSKLS